MKIRKPVPAELAEINSMIMQSKAHWGYDRAFLDACREELSFDEQRLASELVRVCVMDNSILGIVELEISDTIAEISKMFVSPAAIGTGAGRQLFQWAVECARINRATLLRIESDPFALGFYQHMGAIEVGSVPSASIEGRRLPLLHLELKN